RPVRGWWGMDQGRCEVVVWVLSRGRPRTPDPTPGQGRRNGHGWTRRRGQDHRERNGSVNPPVTTSGSTGGRGQVHTAVGRKFTHAVLTEHLTDGTATAAHDQGIGDHVRRLVTHPADQLTVGDTGRGEEHVV